jgi:hypothetical protein
VVSNDSPGVLPRSDTPLNDARVLANAELRPWCSARGELNTKRRPTEVTRLQMKTPAVLTDNAFHDGQAEARPAWFGREERLKYFLANFGRDPGASILHP